MIMKRSIGEVGALVVAQRERLGFDAAPFARLAGVDPKTLASLERGERWPRTKSRNAIESALGWAAGSLTSMLAGGDPLFDDDDAQRIASQIRHPSYRVELEAAVDTDSDVAEVLARVAEGSPVGDGERAIAQRVLDDWEIGRLGELIESLSRAGKLAVSRYARDIAAEEISQQPQMPSFDHDPIGDVFRRDLNADDGGNGGKKRR